MQELDIYGDFEPLPSYGEVKVALEIQFEKLRQNKSQDKLRRFMMNAEKTKIFAADTMIMAKWFEDGEGRRIGDDRIRIQVDEEVARVSTVCLGIDHSWNGGPPKIFESMIFGSDEHESQWRYSTIAQANYGHKCLVECLKNGVEPEVKSIKEPFFELYLATFYPNHGKEE